jgi:hypothetical protein
LRAETFACPECGNEVVPSAAPGLRVACPSCATLVEIPYLPRNLGRGRRRGVARRPAWVAVTASGIALAVLLATLLAIALVRGRVVGQRRGELNGLIAEARAAEARGDLPAAVAGADAAVAFARAGRVPLPGDFSPWRDALAAREAESRLEVARARIAADPAGARGVLLTLRALARDDPAVAPLAGRVAAALDDAREAEARAALAAGETELAAGRPAAALERVARARTLAGELDSTRAAALVADADELAASVVRARGVRIEPPSGDFPLGDPDAYREALLVPAAAALNRAGYLVLEGALAAGPLAPQAAYTLGLAVTETPVRYLATPHRACHLAARLTLRRGAAGATTWSLLVEGQTRIPLPGLSAAESGRYAAAKAALPEAESRCFRDALADAAAALPPRLRSLPAPAP